jgi:phage shock protein PspC (stress-responsive transcriptional regulator)
MVQLYRSRLRKPRFTLAEVGGFVAAFAVAFRWPILLVPTFSVALTLFLTRLGISLILALILVSGALVVLGLTLPAVIVHR